MSKKKSSDIGMFIIGWIASALAIAVPITVLILIQKNLPDVFEKYGDKITILAYLTGAFFSGLFATYRVSCKSEEKDSIIADLEEQIEAAKKAYNALSPKSKIIALLHDLHMSSSNLGKPDILRLIMRRIGEINKDSSFDPRYDGMINHLDDKEFKENKSIAKRENDPVSKYAADEITAVEFPFKRRNDVKIAN